MNYQKLYIDIIEKAIAAKRVKGNEYLERHHIIPKSLGGNNVTTNLVFLTAREHFVCHRILVKITNGRDRSKMIYALWAMANQKNEFQHRRVTSSRHYALLKKQFSETHSKRVVTEVTKQKLRTKALLRLQDPIQRALWMSVRSNGGIISEAGRRDKIMKARARRHSQEVKDKISKGNRGKIVSAATRLLQSKKAALRKPKKWIKKGQKTRHAYVDELAAFLADGWIMGRKIELSSTLLPSK